MKRWILAVPMCVAMLGLLATEAWAVPTTVHFAGRVSNGDGPLNGVTTIAFKFFDAESSGTVLWEETYNAVANAGLVTVELGATNGNELDATVFDGTDVYLELTVNGTAQSPRVRVGSVPYAVVAGDAETLGGLAPGDVALASHNHDSTYAPISHTHTQYALTTHNHDSTYAPISHTHTQYALTTHNHDSTYAPISHNHSGSQITSGTIGTNYYSAYSDLTAEGRLDLSATGDLLTRAQGDARYALAGSSGGFIDVDSFTTSCKSLASVGTSYTKLTDIGTFSKNVAGSAVMISFNGRIAVAGSFGGTGAIFELRVDGSATSNGVARAIIKSSEQGSDGIHASITGVFEGLSAGSHTVSMYVRGSSGTTTSLYIDAGCWTSTHTVVTEIL